MSGAMKKTSKFSRGLVFDTLPLAGFLTCLLAGISAARDHKQVTPAFVLLVQAAVSIIHFANFMSLEMMLDQSSPCLPDQNDAQARFREPFKNLPVYSAILCASLGLMQSDRGEGMGSSLLVLLISALLHCGFMRHKLAQRRLGR